MNIKKSAKLRKLTEHDHKIDMLCYLEGDPRKGFGDIASHRKVKTFQSMTIIFSGMRLIRYTCFVNKKLIGVTVFKIPCRIEMLKLKLQLKKQ